MEILNSPPFFFSTIMAMHNNHPAGIVISLPIYRGQGGIACNPNIPSNISNLLIGYFYIVYNLSSTNQSAIKYFRQTEKPKLSFVACIFSMIMTMMTEGGTGTGMRGGRREEMEEHLTVFITDIAQLNEQLTTSV